ncbi:hypothetical protein [Paenibacillus alvei]|uniref:Uncharacterized protein n=1 Tax=Paenibacillus alvei TaxID=44250 RepID=A0AAP6ZRB0_PAEAL|nr:hypothetical protein [Paenibacillus alvei]MBG9736118.1 hypothetical protein [Paenibacillus alvei]MBG9743418.1 hypothetical protein [Paenibacillus alvei]MCY9579301.1 hypothetical protein [Paenibacillus alvei]MCY9585951.1 hypothetical protein [Paenibacillus alvei]NEZ42892.1 hypothetical protein [Paenibacillus alvei]
MSFSNNQKKANGNGNGNSKKNSKKKANCPNLSIDQIAVIAALLTNSLKVQSVLVDRDQAVEILLVGSLRKKTQMDNLLDQISDLSVGDFLESLKRFGE